jgi:serine/threonine protein phosphatase PrpC
VSDAQSAEILSAPAQSAVESCRLLIEMAKDDGGSDNITCLVVRVREESAAHSSVAVAAWR